MAYDFDGGEEVKIKLDNDEIRNGIVIGKELQKDNSNCWLIFIKGIDSPLKRRDKEIIYNEKK